MARKVVDDMDQAALRKMSPVLRYAVCSAAKAIEQNGFVSLTQNLRETLKKDSFPDVTV